jgi:hypothetical protein
MGGRRRVYQNAEFDRVLNIVSRSTILQGPLRRIEDHKAGVNMQPIVTVG